MVTIHFAPDDPLRVKPHVVAEMWERDTGMLSYRNVPLRCIREGDPPNHHCMYHLVKIDEENYNAIFREHLKLE